MSLPHGAGESFNPMVTPICTRTPSNIEAPTTWFGHLPFAMCLVAMTRPALLVELGTYRGASYFAFCQAVKELGLATRCFAIDTWNGDPQGGFYSEEVYDQVREDHDPHYSLFSTLVRGMFDEVRPQFENASIDLLHIDGFHTYEAVKNDFETWLGKMSEQGVIIFHDIEVRDRPDFGVWRLWDEVKHRYPHFEFLHSHGLGVLAVGSRVPELLRPMLNVPEGEAARIRSFFSNLADRNQDLLLARNEAKARTGELTTAHRDLAIAHGELANVRAETANVREELARLQGEFSKLREELNESRRYSSQKRFVMVDAAVNACRRVPGAYPALRRLVQSIGFLTRPLRAWSRP